MASIHYKDALTVRRKNKRMAIGPISFRGKKIAIVLTLVSIVLISGMANAELQVSTIISLSGSIVPKSLLPLHTEGQYIKDSKNDTIVLQGVARIELTYCGDPDYTSWYKSQFKEIETQYDLLEQYNAKIVRLSLNLAFWEKWHDTSFQGWNIGTYPQIVDNIVNWCRSRGIYVLLDQHGLTYPSTNQNAQVSWDFQTNRKQELLDWYTELATRYRNETAVIGIDIFNEPPANYPGKTTQEVLDTWHTFSVNAIDKIHEVTQNWLIFLEVPGFQISNWKNCPSGFVERPNLVYTAHEYYTSDLGYYSGLNSTNWAPQNYATSYMNGELDVARTEMEALFVQRDFWMLNQSYPVCIDEFGTSTSAPNWNIQINDFYRMLDSYGVSWIQWAWHHCWSHNEEENGPVIYDMLTYNWTNLSPIGQAYANYMSRIEK
jgi:hypothetical protein